MQEIKINSNTREEIIDITNKIESLVKDTKEGLVNIFIKHTSSAITINENDDPNINEDILSALRKIVPKGIWLHDQRDGNADAHIKASLIGNNISIPILNGKLQLGKWQRINFCEFDGPRNRKVLVIIQKF